MIIAGYGDSIAERLRAEHNALAARWFDRLAALLPIDPEDVFPTASLLDHIPALIVAVSAYVQAPEQEGIAANTGVLEKARQLGALRHGQRASLHQVVREFQILGAVLVTFVREETVRLKLSPSADETLRVVSRLHEAVNVVMQATVETFVGLYNRTIAEQAERLEQFTRMATHEWRQPLGSLQFAAALLRRCDLAAEDVGRTLDVIDRNVAHLVEMTKKLEVLARLGQRGDDPVVQRVSARAVALEAARQLREMAEAREVEVRVADGMPELTVDVGRFELVFLNLLSNAIKYSDPEKPARFVEVTGDADDCECRIVVRDNGLGIPPDRIGGVFERFARVHAHRDSELNVSGVGLGLSIVSDCVRAMGGRVDVQSLEGDGTVFTLRLPLTPAASGGDGPAMRHTPPGTH